MTQSIAEIRHEPVDVLMHTPTIQVVSVTEHVARQQETFKLTWRGGHRAFGEPQAWQRVGNRLGVNLRIVLAEHSQALISRDVNTRALPPMCAARPTHEFWMTWNFSGSLNMPLTPWIAVHRLHHAMINSYVRGGTYGSRMHWLDAQLTGDELKEVDHLWRVFLGPRLEALVDIENLEKRYTFTLHLPTHIARNWMSHICKAVISAGSAQHLAVAEPDQAAEFWTASVLQPRKWQQHVEDPLGYLPREFQRTYLDREAAKSNSQFQSLKPQTQNQFWQIANEFWQSHQSLAQTHALLMRDRLVALNEEAHSIFHSGCDFWKL